MSTELQVEIRGLLPTPNGVGVLLGAADKVISIFVDHAVAAAITMYQHGIKSPRPLTHDLMANLLAGLGARIQKVVINDLRQETFYARLCILQANELGRNLIEVDARPSDSIALALQAGCPILVTRAVWEQADDMTWALSQIEGDTGPTPT